MTNEPARPCSELLLAYQGVVVHDLRGDLNGLLLTVDFLRRQLSTRPEVSEMFGETLGDLDHVRNSLNRTLNQLDMVGHARKAISRADHADIAFQNLSELVNEVVRNHLTERARRRRIEIHSPPGSNIAVKADPVLVHLAIQRMLYGMTELAKDTELNIAIERSHGDAGVIRSWYGNPEILSGEVFQRIENPSDNEPKSGAIPALILARCLAEAMGGKLARDEDHGGGGLCMELPMGSGLSVEHPA